MSFASSNQELLCAQTLLQVSEQVLVPCESNPCKSIEPEAMPSRLKRAAETERKIGTRDGRARGEAPMRLSLLAGDTISVSYLVLSKRKPKRIRKTGARTCSIYRAGGVRRSIRVRMRGRRCVAHRTRLGVRPAHFPYHALSCHLLPKPSSDGIFFSALGALTLAFLLRQVHSRQEQYCNTAQDTHRTRHTLVEQHDKTITLKKREKKSCQTKPKTF